MTKILLTYFLVFSVLIACAQGNTKSKPEPTQQDMDKALKDAQKMIDQLPPEAKEYLKASHTELPKDVKIDKSTMDAYKNRPKNIVNTDTIIDEEVEAELRLASIGTTITKTIGPEGGVITSKNGKISLNFPQGALIKNTDISIVESNNEAPNGCGNSFNLLPDGLSFPKPVKLTLKYTNNEINGSGPEALRVIAQRSDGDYEADMNTTLDVYTKTISSAIFHFSKWGFAAGYKLYIEPEIKYLIKRQTITLRVVGWTVSPDKKETAAGKLIIKNIKQTTYLSDLTDRSTQKNLPNPGYAGFNGFYKVAKWDLLGVSHDKSLLGKITPITDDLTMVTYTTPKIISGGFLLRKAIITVVLEPNKLDDHTIKKAIHLELCINIVEDGELDFSINGKNIKALQQTSTKLAVKASKSNLTGTNQEMVDCWYTETGDLFIGSTCLNPMQKGGIHLSLFFSHPDTGENKLTCIKYGSWGSDYQVKMTGADFEAENYEIKREKRGSGDGCESNGFCRDFIVSLDVFDKQEGGLVTGRFSGELYQDGEDFADACKSSLKLPVKGVFTLILHKYKEQK
ncbi:MAG: hypothetical protein WCI92_10235 [Bacteroidota bacterium]